MKNALILHGTDFEKTQTQRYTNWFPWLKTELEKLGYVVCVPELPQAWHPNLERYWNTLKDFDYNSDTLLIGHSSGAAAMFGILHRLAPEKKVLLAVSVAGFYRDEGWNCEGLFTETFDWEKIKNQTQKIKIICSRDDPYISAEQTEFLAEHTSVFPVVFTDKKHFNLEAGENFRQFPELLEIIRAETEC